MEIFTLQDNREIFVGEAGQRKLIENWTTGYYLVVLEHSCYLVAGKIHRFQNGCVEGVRALLGWLRQEQDGMEIQMGLFANPLVAFAGQSESAFCKTCFPSGPTAKFMTEEYLGRITGLEPAELQVLREQFEKEIEGLK